MLLIKKKKFDMKLLNVTQFHSLSRMSKDLQQYQMCKSNLLIRNRGLCAIWIYRRLCLNFHFKFASKLLFYLWWIESPLSSQKVIFSLIRGDVHFQMKILDRMGRKETGIEIMILWNSNSWKGRKIQKGK